MPLREHVAELKDLLNNKIGRIIGEKLKNADNKAIAKAVIDEYYKNGLWMATGNDKDGYSIKKVKLTKKSYNKALKEIEKAGENGLHKKSADEPKK